MYHSNNKIQTYYIEFIFKYKYLLVKNMYLRFNIPFHKKTLIPL